eukprot:22544-Eustigmatos_ZCMA.PRE.1
MQDGQGPAALRGKLGRQPPGFAGRARIDGVRAELLRSQCQEHRTREERQRDRADRTGVDAARGVEADHLPVPALCRTALPCLRPEERSHPRHGDVQGAAR